MSISAWKTEHHRKSKSDLPPDNEHFCMENGESSECRVRHLPPGNEHFPMENGASSDVQVRDLPSENKTCACETDHHRKSKSDLPPENEYFCMENGQSSEGLVQPMLRPLVL
eukprot:3619198-Amphidinium_carterae.1